MGKKDSSREKSVEVLIGQRVQKRRKELKFTQEKLGAKVGVSYQQIQKYEKGTDRMFVSRMLLIADALNVDPCYFIKGLGSSNEMPFPSKDDQRLLRAYAEISSEKLKQHALAIVRGLAKASAA